MFGRLGYKKLFAKSFKGDCTEGLDSCLLEIGKIRIDDILDSIAAIQSRTCDLSFAEFEQNETVVKAVLFDFIMIGEATRNIPPEIQTIAPNIPWRLMGDMRNVMTHEYFQVDLQIVWDGIQGDLPYVVEPLKLLQKNASNH